MMFWVCLGVALVVVVGVVSFLDHIASSPEGDSDDVL